MTTGGWRRLAFGVGLVAITAACTSARLFGDKTGTDPDRATFKGHLCTDDPADRQFPVKVLFLVDTSIGVQDPIYATQRGDSMQRLVRQYSGPNYSYGVIRFGGPLKGTSCGLRNLTPDGYSKNIDDAVVGVRCTDSMNPGRDLLSALSLANSFISGDVLKTSLGLRTRTKYVVILLTYGPPSFSLESLWCSTQPVDPPLMPGTQDCTDAFAKRFCNPMDVQPTPASCERYQYSSVVASLKDLVVEQEGAQEFHFHIVYQPDPNGVRNDPVAAKLFPEVALAGAGQVWPIAGPGNCDVNKGDTAGCLFSEINIDSTQSLFLRRELIVSNRSALATATGLKVDSDQDGLSDEVEMMIGTDPTNPDTDGDFLSDRTEHILRKLGLDPLVNNLTTTTSWPRECPLPGGPNPNGFPPDQDQDGDRLTDCEELLIRTDPTLFDSDADGIPDSLEFRYGTNPISNDALSDTDADGFTNIDEYRIGLDPLAKDPVTDFVSKYEFSNEKEQQVLSFTQPFQITGIEITSVTDASREGRGTLYYDPPADPSQPVSASNPAMLSWRDPQDTSNGTDPMSPGRGAAIPITGDGHFTLPSASYNAMDPMADLQLTVDVTAVILPRDPIRNDVRLRRGDRICFDFKVSGVQLVNTLPDPNTHKPGINFIDIFLAEVPQSNPTSYGVFRVATIPIQYPQGDIKKAPRRAEIVVTEEDFLLYGE